MAGLNLMVIVLRHKQALIRMFPHLLSNLVERLTARHRSITGMTPEIGAIIRFSKIFALVTDPSGVSSVSFKVWPDNGVAQSFRATHTTGDEWAIILTGFSTGPWNWQVTAKDGAAKGEIPVHPVLSILSLILAVVGTPGYCHHAEWSAGGVVQNAAGRIYFEMPGRGVQAGLVMSVPAPLPKWVFQDDPLLLLPRIVSTTMPTKRLQGMSCLFRIRPEALPRPIWTAVMIHLAAGCHRLAWLMFKLDDLPSPTTLHGTMPITLSLTAHQGTPVSSDLSI